MRISIVAYQGKGGGAKVRFLGRMNENEKAGVEPTVRDIRRNTLKKYDAAYVVQKIRLLKK